MKRIRRFKEIYPCQSSGTQIKESLIGKGVAFAQNRQHGSNKAKLNSVLSHIQSNAHRGAIIDDSKEQIKLIFDILSDLTTALKFAADMSTNCKCPPNPILLRYLQPA